MEDRGNYVCMFPFKEDYLIWLQACMGKIEVVETRDVGTSVVVLWRPVK